MLCPTENERPYNAINRDYRFCLVQKKASKEVQISGCVVTGVVIYTKVSRVKLIDLAKYAHPLEKVKRADFPSEEGARYLLKSLDPAM